MLLYYLLFRRLFFTFNYRVTLREKTALLVRRIKERNLVYGPLDTHIRIVDGWHHTHDSYLQVYCSFIRSSLSRTLPPEMSLHPLGYTYTTTPPPLSSSQVIIFAFRLVMPNLTCLLVHNLTWSLLHPHAFNACYLMAAEYE